MFQMSGLVGILIAKELNHIYKDTFVATLYMNQLQVRFIAYFLIKLFINSL